MPGQRPGILCGSVVVFLREQHAPHKAAPQSPKVAICKLLNSLKGVSDRRVRAICSFLRKRFWTGVLCSPGQVAAASCGGAHDSHHPPIHCAATGAD
jgi:hypothetical protein